MSHSKIPTKTKLARAKSRADGEAALAFNLPKAVVRKPKAGRLSTRGNDDNHEPKNGGVVWIGSYKLDPFKPLPSKTPPIEVQVVSLDWKWLFIYPDQGVAAVNQLVIPAGTPVEFRLTSATVMNSFFVPQLGSQIYAMGGMTTHLSLLADKPGEFPGFSANFSGDGFSWMRFVVKSVPAGDFNTWLAQVRGAGSALDAAGYAELAKPSQAVPPTTYRSVEPKLFERIIDQTVAGPGPGSVDRATGAPPHKAGG